MKYSPSLPYVIIVPIVPNEVWFWEPKISYVSAIVSPV